MRKFYFKFSRQLYAELLRLFCAIPLYAQIKTMTDMVNEIRILVEDILLVGRRNSEQNY
mgnify:FL=1